MVKSLLVLSLLVASALAATYSQPRIDPSGNWRVVGGKPAEDGAHPHQISLRFNGYPHCGGSIVNKEWVITAAQCVIAETAAPYLTVVAGSNSLSSGGDTYQVLEIHYHEKYDSIKKQNDVAILKVEPITFNENVAPIAVETEDVGGDEPCILTGWGLTSYPGSTPDKLQEIDLNTTTVEDCKSRSIIPIIESEICTLTQVGEGACYGDTGGPLSRNGKLIGIVSWSQPCALGFPDVFSRVSSFVPWFNEKCNCLN